MAYSNNLEPDELTALTSLDSGDVFVVGDTSDANEPAKHITKTNIITDLSASHLLCNMPHDLKKEIENHLASFPERYKEVEEMKQEWREFRTRSTWVLVGFITSMLAIGVWVGTMQTHIESVTDHDSEDKQHFAQIESRVNVLEVNNGEIRTRLASIELTLQEIKTAIIRIQ